MHQQNRHPRESPLAIADGPRYIPTMRGFFLILMALAMAALLLSLLAGVFLMARGGEANTRRSNQLMRLRVALQGLAIALFILVLITQAS